MQKLCFSGFLFILFVLGKHIEAQTCPPLLSPPNGRASCDTIETNVGGSCAISCNEGFHLSGSSQIKCVLGSDGNATFNSTDYSCNAITCDVLSSPDLGNMSCTNGASYNSICTFTCIPGYEIEVDVTRTCTIGTGTQGEWTGEPAKCIDKDECSSDDKNDCNFYAACTNTIGGYNCTCQDGFVGDGVICTGPTCPPLLSPPNGRSSCDTMETEVGGSCAISCFEGFHLVGLSQVKCVLGNDGNGTFPQTNQTCEAITCVDLIEPDKGSISCTDNFQYNSVCTYTCNVGYELDIDGIRTCQDGVGTNGEWTGEHTSCIDVDECSNNLDDCDSNASCMNTDGSFNCTCNEGWSGDGKSCIEITCPQLAAPANGEISCTDGVSYNSQCTFMCESGFEVSGSEVRQCQSDVGPNGQWSGNDTSCIDIDECIDPKACGTHGICNNTIGGFVCTCSEGWQGDGVSCKDIDECLLTGTLQKCHPDAGCTNTVGSFQCSCKDGYEGDGILSCIDKDECTTTPNLCDVNAECANSIGSYVCTCNEGFSGDGGECTATVCVELKQPDDGSLSCSDQSQLGSTCTYSCDAGYDLMGSQVRICEDGTIAFGEWSGEPTSCNDIDECNFSPSVCTTNSICTNIPGNYSCQCKDGFTSHEDECIGPQCSLPQYRLSEGIQVTQDINECIEGTSNCDPNAVCTNTEGSFKCTCNDGWQEKFTACIDIDECGTNTDDCHAAAVCTNTQGSFTCACKDGWDGDGKVCEDINECTSLPGLCGTNTDCVNTDGSYNCSCKVGWTGDPVSCTDINECETEICHTEATCTNTLGSYKCKCNPGFEGNGQACSDINECADNTHDCDENADCLNIVRNFTCVCKVGWKGDGRICADVDECANTENACAENAKCTNTEGSFNCECNEGWFGDGKTCEEATVTPADGSTTAGGENEDEEALLLTGAIVGIVLGSVTAVAIGTVAAVVLYKKYLLKLKIKDASSWK